MNKRALLLPKMHFFKTVPNTQPKPKETSNNFQTHNCHPEAQNPMLDVACCRDYKDALTPEPLEHFAVRKIDQLPKTHFKCAPVRRSPFQTQTHRFGPQPSPHQLILHHVHSI